MVRIDCLVLKAGQKDEAAEAIAEIKSITPEQAHEEMDRAGRRRYILAKNLSQAEAREYAERFNAIHPKCAEFTKPRLG